MPSPSRPSPSRRGLSELRTAAASCTDCDLYIRASQTVFGEGPIDAQLALVGEQPGDREDKEGHPFVGPAGGVLDRALEGAGVSRDGVYLTNAVKHFKWAPRGKVRLHQKPNAAEMRACAQWWRAELAVVEPAVVVLLGATAAHAVLGPSVRVTRDRGQVRPDALGDAAAVVTFHPSAVLRAADDARDLMFRHLVDDLRLAVDVARQPAP